MYAATSGSYFFEELMDIDFDSYSVPEIKQMIAEGKCTNDDVVHYYNNEFWDEQP